MNHGFGFVVAFHCGKMKVKTLEFWRYFWWEIHSTSQTTFSGVVNLVLHTVQQMLRIGIDHRHHREALTGHYKSCPMGDASPLFGRLHVPENSLRWSRRSIRIPWVWFAAMFDDKEKKIPSLVGGWATPLKKKNSELGWLFPIYGRIENVPNHHYTITHPD